MGSEAAGINFNSHQRSEPIRQCPNPSDKPAKLAKPTEPQVHGWLLPYPDPGDYHFREGVDYANAYSLLAANYASHYIDAFTTGLPHDPSRTDNPYTDPPEIETQIATSEAISYGLTLFVNADEQGRFDQLLIHSEDHLNSHGLACWAVTPAGTSPGNFSIAAADADQLNVLDLIAAASLVREGYWSTAEETATFAAVGSAEYSTYEEKALVLLDRIWTYLTADAVVGGVTRRALKAGDSVWTVDQQNLSYYNPAAYRVFADFEAAHGVTGHDWNALTETYYYLLNEANPAAAAGYPGLCPDWMALDGSPAHNPWAPAYYLSYNFGWDALRVPSYAALDRIWLVRTGTDESRAGVYLDNAADFFAGEISDHGRIMANYDVLTGEPADTSTYLEFVGGVGGGMMGSGNEAMKASFNSHLSSNFNWPRGFWGLWDGAIDYYYVQSVCTLFGAGLMGGLMADIYRDLGGSIVVENGPPARPQEIEIKNHPNPFNGQTMITLQLAKLVQGQVEVVDLLGRRVARIFEGQMMAGQRSFIWDGKNEQGQQLPSGTYKVQITNNNNIQSSTMLLIK